MKILLLLMVSLLSGSCVQSTKNLKSQKSLLFFNHTYFHTLDKTFIKKLESAGFIVDKKGTEHPGSVMSYFVYIGDKMDGPVDTHLTPPYLEFGYIRSKSEYRKEYKKYEVPEEPEALFSWKGYSLGTREPLMEYSKKIGKRSKVNLVHKNYDWRNNSKDKLPGWNFLMFDDFPFDLNFFLWFTESDIEHPKKDKKYAVQKNGAQSIAGIILDVKTSKERSFLEKIVGRQFVNKELLIDEKHKIIDWNMLNQDQKNLFSDKIRQYKAVIVEFEKGALDQIKLPYEKTLLFKNKVKVLKFGKDQWDLVLIEGKI